MFYLSIKRKRESINVLVAIPTVWPKRVLFSCFPTPLKQKVLVTNVLILHIPFSRLLCLEKDEPEVPLKKSLIVIGPNNITVSEGETIQLHCLTQAGATVQWLHDGEMINLNVMRRYEMLPSGGLRIVSAQKSDSGVYECLASKIGFGTSSSKCFVQIQGLEINVPG